MRLGAPARLPPLLIAGRERRRKMADRWTFGTVRIESTGRARYVMVLPVIKPKKSKRL